MLKLKSLAVVISSTLVLTGCAINTTFLPNILEFSNPANQCDGQEVYLKVSDRFPLLSQEDQTDLTLTVEDSSGQLVSENVLNSLEIEYRLGVFSQNGFETLDNDFFSERSQYSSSLENPKPLPSRDSLYDFAWDQAGESYDLDGPQDGFTYFPITLTSSRSNGTLAEILNPDISDPQESFLLLMALATLPGAFLAKCKSLSDDPYIAAAQVFPNSSTLDLEPSIFVDDLVVYQGEPPTEQTLTSMFLELGAISPNEDDLFIANGAIFPKLTNPLSPDPMTNRWVNSLSTHVNSQPHSLGIGLGSLFNGDISQSVMRTNYYLPPLSPGNYELVLSYFNYQNVVMEGDGLDLNSETSSVSGGTSYYDLTVSQSGVYTFTLIEVMNPIVVRSDSWSPPELAIEETRLVTSTKGFREVTIKGSSLDLVSGVSVGGEEAKLISRTPSELVLHLPKKKSGRYDLVITHSKGQMTKRNWVRYYKSVSIRTAAVSPTATGTSWIPELRKAVRATPKAVQVNCVVSIPPGTTAKALTAKARSVCAEASAVAAALNTKVIVKRGPVGAAPSLLLRFWN
jgi:hypothetical protein